MDLYKNAKSGENLVRRITELEDLHFPVIKTYHTIIVIKMELNRRGHRYPSGTTEKVQTQIQAKILGLWQRRQPPRLWWKDSLFDTLGVYPSHLSHTSILGGL